MTRGCEAGRAGRAALGRWPALVALVVLGVMTVGGCRRRPLCPQGQEETRVSADAIWCRDAKAGVSSYLLFHAGTRQVRQRCNFVGGQLAGPFQAFHPGGQRWVEGTYASGLLNGKWVQWDAAGHKVAEGDYRDGRLVQGAPVAVASLCGTVTRVE